VPAVGQGREAHRVPRADRDAVHHPSGTEPAQGRVQVVGDACLIDGKPVETFS